ncbi:putative nucleic acid-binding protein [Halopolyspora algeriensis]|uniref:Ribonuclease VapC n=1 Tax=Halopolyspora algeriensis TaxID=1500506 RepID=A0A368VNG8_9ACTN|nr:type II toxin-antitoxin system VapC family toxin [Halopolyspora algeriensis]RCW43261.1 putative nucleic acid-binding protein [Halopolyspora algeriensis]TQM56320.1 putative nucleic acid-binding protein [Halopolyspora algeriensis]
MIVDASLVIDAIGDPGARGVAARSALAAQPATEPLTAPGHFAFEVMSGLRAAANRPNHPMRDADLTQALRDAEALEIRIEATSWSDVQRAWALAQASLRYADAIYVATAERYRTALLTADARIKRSGAPITCEIITIAPTGHEA